MKRYKIIGIVLLLIIATPTGKYIYNRLHTTTLEPLLNEMVLNAPSITAIKGHFGHVASANFVIEDTEDINNIIKELSTISIYSLDLDKYGNSSHNPKNGDSFFFDFYHNDERILYIKIICSENLLYRTRFKPSSSSSFTQYEHCYNSIVNFPDEATEAIVKILHKNYVPEEL